MTSDPSVRPGTGTDRDADPVGAPRVASRAYALGAVLLGLALGGFFDGILLHQILGWHHLASGRVASLQWNLLLDGVFHALMFVLAVAALLVLWHAAKTGAMPGGRRFLGWVLLGAGGFHVFDALVNHWVLGLHRIHPDGHVLLWDMLFFVLGVVLVLVGWSLRRERARGDGP